MTLGIGKAIKNLRKEAGFSQEKVAERLGVSSQAVSKWELGLAFPDITLLRPIAELFGVTVDSLLEDGADSGTDGTRVVRAAGYMEVSLERRFGIFREGLLQMPRNTGLLADAIGTGYLLVKEYFDSRDIRAEAYFDDTIALCNRLLSISHDINELNYANFMLALLYAMLGRDDESEEIIKQLPALDRAVTSGAVRTAVAQTSGTAEQELEARVDSLEQMIKTAANEAAQIRRTLAKLFRHGTDEKEGVILDDSTTWVSKTVKIGSLRFFTSAISGDYLYYFTGSSDDLCRYHIDTGESDKIATLKNVNFLCAAPDGSLRALSMDKVGTGDFNITLHNINTPDQNPLVESYSPQSLTSARSLNGFFTADRNGNICFGYTTMSKERLTPGNSVIVVVSPRGEILNRLYLSETEPHLSRGFRLSDGRAAVVVIEQPQAPDKPSARIRIAPINPGTGQWDEFIYHDGLRINNLSGHGKYLHFTLDVNMRLEGYNTETGSFETIFSCTDAGVNTMQIQDFAATGDGRYRFLSVVGEQCEIATVYRTSDTDDRIRLTLGAATFSGGLRRHVLDFNRANKDYRIDIIEYEMRGTTAESVADSEYELFRDITAGKVPDILYIGWQPFEFYASRGVFADLYEFIDTDSEFNRECFLPGVLKLFERNGKLPFVSSSVVPEVYFGTPQISGNETRLTFQKLRELMDAHPGVSAAYNLTREMALRDLLMNNIGGFIDWQTRETRFTDGAFAEALELCRMNPTAVGDITGYTDKPFEDALRDGEFLFDKCSLISAVCFQSPRELFGEDFTVVAPPSRSGRGFPAYASEPLAVSERCEHKEAAWQFVRSVLLGDNTIPVSLRLPVLKNAFNTTAEHLQAQEYIDPPEDYDNMHQTLKEYYDGLKRDENGRMLKPKMTTSIGSAFAPRQETYYAAEPQDCERVLSVIAQCDRLQFYDLPLLNRLSEEAKPYFDGKISAEELAVKTDEIVRAHYGF